MGKLIRFRKQGKARDEAERALFPPFQTPATDARPASFPSDASATADVPRAGVAPDPAIVRKQTRKRRGAILALVLVFMAGVAAALFGDRGYLDVQRQQRRLRELRESSEARQQRVAALNREIDRLKVDPSAVERIAREELGYVAPGEITLLLPAETPANAPGLDAKDGSGIVPAARSTH
jgi:cell division protein FtsB